MELHVSNLDELAIKAKELLAFIGDSRIVLINGQMGAGKTTLVQTLLKEMGIEHPEGSPTYSLINEYDSLSYGKIYHLDLYRLKDKGELYDIGIEDIIDGNSYCFVEWPGLLISMLQGECVEVNLSLEANLTRKISAKKIPN